MRTLSTEKLTAPFHFARQMPMSNFETVWQQKENAYECSDPQITAKDSAKHG